MSTASTSGLRAVVFDMDGVVIDSQAAANYAWVEAAAKHGIRLDVGELEDLVGASEQQFWQYVHGRYALPEPLEHYRASYDEDLEIARYDETLVSPALGPLLRELRAAGLHTALATSGSRKRMNAVLELYQLRSAFDVALCREDTPREKPAPELFLAVCSALGVAPANCLALEDSVPGISAARAAGMPVLGFVAYCPPNSLRPGADAYVTSFEGLNLAQLRAFWSASPAAVTVVQP